jgi:hypothetical protein
MMQKENGLTVRPALFNAEPPVMPFHICLTTVFLLLPIADRSVKRYRLPVGADDL